MEEPTASESITNELPKIISVDDHIVEPTDLWTSRLPAKYRDRAPRVERKKGFTKLDFDSGELAKFVEDSDADEARWCDQWAYDDLRWPFAAGYAAIGPLREVPATTAISYDDMLPGCYDQAARLADMDSNHVEASMCFPTFPRFCGQTFLEREDKELALLCVRAYNDFMIDEWCAGAGYGRLIPQAIIPLWDPQLAADEIHRCAAKGSHAVTFSEIPPYLNLPSIHSGHWDPFFAACDETETVVNMHIGSGSKMTITSVDAPLIVLMALTAQNAESGFVDWLSSGKLAQFPNLRIAFSEGQAGWMPFLLERLDRAWERCSTGYDAMIRERVPEPPSSYVPGRVFACIFDDLHGLESRQKIGMDQLLFETDYPHNDSTFPNSKQVAAKHVAAGGLTEHETWQLIRGNAISCYGLQRFGITS
jgi:predicted TIM-barrel fold metal-dependent hydrolase